MNGGAGFRPAPLVAFGGFSRRASWRCFRPLPVSPRLLPFLGAFPLSVSVSTSVLLSCVFAPFSCVFWRVACLSCGYPLRPFDFNALFKPFTAFFRSARAIYQDNKKSPF